MSTATPPPTGRLNDTQVRIIRGLAHGRTMKQIAQDMNYSYGSIASALGWARYNMGAASNAHLVAICLEKRLLDGRPTVSDSR